MVTESPMERSLSEVEMVVVKSRTLPPLFCIYGQG